MKIKKKLAAAGCSIGLALAGLAVATPAEAAASYVRICNSIYSADNIIAYNGSLSISINQGACANITDSGGNARVDVDPSGGESDVGSWRKRRGTDSTYGACVNNEEGASNPYSEYTGQETLYRTWPYTGC